MKKKLLLFSCLIFLSGLLAAQKASFVHEGEIVFEKTVNIHAVLKKGIDARDANRIAAYEQYKKTQPQFLVQKSKLAFTKIKTAYLPEVSTAGSSLSYFGLNARYLQINKVFTNLSTDSVVVEKEFLSQRFLVKDKVLPIKWKITNETREIAGYLCRRANGLIKDSIYVVAFYTTKIPVPSGPESIHGLPGMILGVAMPYENVTWFATTVTEKKNAESQFIASKKGKVATRIELEDTLRKFLKSISAFSEYTLLGYLL